MQEDQRVGKKDFHFLLRKARFLVTQNDRFFKK